MENKILFMIIQNQIQYLSNSSMDHREWYNSLGLDPNNFENIVRGMIVNQKIIFFKGINYTYDDEVIMAAKMYSPYIRDYVKNDSLPVYCGILFTGGYGNNWEPILEIKNDEIGFIPKQVQEPKVNKNSNTIVSGPIIEFKNDYQDPLFIKRAIIVTICVIVISLIIKVYLFSQEKILRTGNIMDYLLCVVQVGLLGFCIYGYMMRKSYTKYISMIAAAVLIWTFDWMDVLLGIIYFLFSIDQKYFVLAYQKIQELIKRLKDMKKT